MAIVGGLTRRGLPLAVENVVPIRTEGYPTKAKRPANSRLDLTRLKRVFGIETPSWDAALAVELDRLAAEFRKA
jgi:dTDP-4-dehydrorhamnose reductase